MTSLSDLVEAYKREVAIPGGFETAFPGVSDVHIEAALGDAFGEAQLDGFFGRLSLDVDAGEITPDLSTAGAALVVLYAGMRLLRQQIRSTSSGSKYKAGPVSYETSKSATSLLEDLKYLTARRLELVANARRGGGTQVFMIEGYAPRGTAHNLYGSFFDYEDFVQLGYGV